MWYDRETGGEQPWTKFVSVTLWRMSCLGGPSTVKAKHGWRNLWTNAWKKQWEISREFSGECSESLKVFQKKISEAISRKV